VALVDEVPAGRGTAERAHGVRDGERPDNRRWARLPCHLRAKVRFIPGAVKR